jgi:uncharacterized protein YcfJ
MNRNQIILVILGAFLLVIATAAASTYIAKSSNDTNKPAVVAHKAHNNGNITWNDNHPTQATPVQTASNCDDGNVAGKVVGGVGGGVLGSQIGKGNGKTVGTIAGTLGGAYLGGQYIPTRNVTCR